METRTISVLKARIARIVFFAIALIVSIGILQKICEIPIVEKNVELKAHAHSAIDIDIYNPYTLDIYGKLFDVTKTKYNYYIEDFRSLHIYDLVCFNHTTENLDFSPIIGVKDSHMDAHCFYGFPDKANVSFFTRQLLSEQIQTIRIFFLTELIVFFLMFIWTQLIKIVPIVFMNGADKLSLYHNPNWLKGCSFIYLVTILVCAFLLYRINLMPVVNINGHMVKQKAEVFYNPHDISRSLYRISSPKAEDGDSTYIINFEEMVSFLPMNGEPIEVGLSQIVYKVDSANQDDITFYTTNFESENLQEIRIFFLTTLLLLFLGRFLFYMKKITIYYWHPLKLYLMNKYFITQQPKKRGKEKIKEKARKMRNMM